MVTKSTTMNAATPRRLAAAFVAALGCLVATQTAQAQEILMSGPLAGAPAVRKLRLYREGRLELAPAVTFTLLDEYERTILAGAKLNYNITDWLAIGAWGAFGAVHMPTALTEHIENYHAGRGCTGSSDTDELDCRLTYVNLDYKGKLRNQVGQIAWVGSPQLTLTPFRGKISAFGSLYVDTDLHFFGGLAFVGLNERADCAGADICKENHTRKARTAITGTFGLGLTFFTHQWGGLGVDWRALPLSRNTGGFDTAGQGPNDAFPDLSINSKDREFKLTQMVTVSYSMFFPFEYRVSE
ncbi:MAG: hypothetical protein QM784_01615 [Polyangiaceae bacterium]